MRQIKNVQNIVSPFLQKRMQEAYKKMEEGSIAELEFDLSKKMILVQVIQI